MFQPRATSSNHHSALFFDKEVNTGRQMQVDMAKMFAIFFMVIIHTFEGGDADMETGLGYFFDSIAGAQFGAPVFMIVSGRYHHPAALHRLGTTQTSLQTENVIH